MHTYWLILGALASWRISHLLSSESGPWQVLDRLRGSMHGFLKELFHCIYCISVWVAAPLAYWIGVSWKERLLLWPALSACAIVLERIIDRDGQIPETVYFEDGNPEQERENYVLRKEQDDIWVGRR